MTSKEMDEDRRQRLLQSLRAVEDSLDEALRQVLVTWLEDQGGVNEATYPEPSGFKVRKGSEDLVN